jgi:hypothetical protein
MGIRRKRSISKPAVTGLAMILAANAAFSEDRNERGAYAIGLWGDLPYSDSQALEGVPNLIQDMNSQRLAFTIHDGDLKGGNSTANSVTPTTCSDELYTQALGFFQSLRAPAIFTPGDNDWTDCDRTSNGGYDSLERLEYERTVFFASPYSLGKRRLVQEVQDAPYVENRRWDYNGVTYVTLNVQGSCNNLCDVNPDPAEFADRNAANIVWLRAAFAHAVERGSAGLMIVAQANPGWDGTDGTRTQTRNPKTLVATDNQPDGYASYLQALREEVISFAKPVAYVHGDSHYFRVDRPLVDSAGRRLENFTRVETFGDNASNGNNDVQWVKVSVDPNSREVFAYQAQIVPGNRVAVPAPADPTLR